MQYYQPTNQTDLYGDKVTSLTQPTTTTVKPTSTTTAPKSTLPVAPLSSTNTTAPAPTSPTGQTTQTTATQVAQYIPGATLPNSPTAPTALPTAPSTNLGTPVSTTPPAVTLPAQLPTVPPGTTQLSDTGFGNPPITVAEPLPSLPRAAGAVPGADVLPFGPGNDLRFDAILPDAGVNRLDLANQYFDQFQEASNPAYEQALREATQRAAANGILGSGMLTNTYGDVATQRAHDLDLARRGFLTDALQGTIQDAINNRAELRGERGYQTDQARQAVQDEIQRILLESQLGNQSFNQQLDLAQLLGQLGFAGNPDDALLTGSSQQQAQADQYYAMIGQLLQQLGQRS